MSLISSDWEEMMRRRCAPERLGATDSGEAMRYCILMSLTMTDVFRE